MKKREKKAGFTLAELLIVIAILAILVAIAIPVFTTDRNKAGLAADHANMRTLKTYALTLASTGVLDVGGQHLEVSKADYSIYCFMKDGTLKLVGGIRDIANPKTPDGAYLAQGSEDNCKDVIGDVNVDSSKYHKKKAALFLFISFNSGTYQTTISWWTTTK